MSDFRRFMKKNKVVKKDILYAATESLTDEDGKPLKWRLRHISSKEIDDMREKCTRSVQVTGHPDQFREELDNAKLQEELVCAVVVEPDLRNAELQNSYGVKTPGALVHEMIDDPGEYDNLFMMITKMNGFDKPFDAKVEEAKN